MGLCSRSQPATSPTELLPCVDVNWKDTVTGFPNQLSTKLASQRNDQDKGMMKQLWKMLMQFICPEKVSNHYLGLWWFEFSSHNRETRQDHRLSLYQTFLQCWQECWLHWPNPIVNQEAVNKTLTFKQTFDSAVSLLLIDCMFSLLSSEEYCPVVDGHSSFLYFNDSNHTTPLAKLNQVVLASQWQNGKTSNVV